MTIRCLTIQSENVIKSLRKNGYYRSGKSNSMFAESYKIMKEYYKYRYNPIFMSPVGYYANMGGARIDGKMYVLELEVSIKDIKFQDYYIWSDFIYFVSEYSGFVDLNEAVKDYFPAIGTFDNYKKHVMECKPDIKSKRVYQVSTQEIRREQIKSVRKLDDMFKQKFVENGGQYILKL